MSTTSENNASGRWYLGNPDTKKGPFSTEMIKKAIVEKKIALTMQAVMEGRDDWKPLSKIPEFLDVCVAVPPPVPGNRWYLGSSDAKKGPFSAEIIKKGIQESRIATTMQAVMEGRNDWKPLYEIPEFLEVCLIIPTPPAPPSSDTNEGAFSAGGIQKDILKEIIAYCQSLFSGKQPIPWLKANMTPANVAFCVLGVIMIILVFNGLTQKEPTSSSSKSGRASTSETNRANTTQRPLTEEERYAQQLIRQAQYAQELERRKQPCVSCHGTGLTSIPCTTCKGSGVDPYAYKPSYGGNPCYSCKGKCVLSCRICNGQGFTIK